MIPRLLHKQLLAKSFKTRAADAQQQIIPVIPLCKPVDANRKRFEVLDNQATVEDGVPTVHAPMADLRPTTCCTMCLRRDQ